jgi:putative peptidoglycan lipid II flippase
LSAICVLGIVFSPQLVATLAPGFDPGKAALTVTLTRIMFPFILLVSIAALVMGMLNAKNVFGMPAMASSFFNIGSIVGGVLLGAWLDPQFGPRALIGLAIGTLIGGAMQLGVQLPRLRRLGYQFNPDFAWRDAGVNAILALMGPSLVAASTTQLNVLVNSMFASTLGDGPIFWLAIAFRLMQLPLGLFGVALGTVTLPLLSRLAVGGDMAAFRGELARAMRLGFLLTIPSAIGLMMLAEPIISVLYQHGRFDAHQTAEAAGALRFYAIGLCGYAALKVLVNAFYALDRRKTPMLVSFFAVALNLLFNWIFTFRLGWGHRGLAFSTGCVATFNFLLLYALMHARLKRLETRRMLAMLGKVALASAALALICWCSRHWLLADWPTQAFVGKLGSLLLTVVTGALVFLGCGAALRIEELHTLRVTIQRRLRRGT